MDWLSCLKAAYSKLLVRQLTVTLEPVFAKTKSYTPPVLCSNDGTACKKKSRYGKGSFIVDEGVVFWNLRCICLSLCNPSLSAPANLWSSSTSTNCVTLAVGFHLYALFVVRQHCWWKIPTCGMVQYWYIVPFACYGNRAFQHCLCSGSVRVGAVDLRTKRPRIYCMLHRLSWKSSSIYLLHKKNKATKVS